MRKKTDPGPSEFRQAQHCRARAVGDSHLATGYASVFNQEAVIVGWDGRDEFREVVRPGAFTKTLAEGDPRALWQHDPSQPIGRMSRGTLRLAEDAEGLHTEIDLPVSALGGTVLAAIKRGDVDGMSIGFWVIRDRWTRPDDALPLREVLEIRLLEVSPVTFPAFDGTSIGARGLDPKDVVARAEQRGLLHRPAASIVKPVDGIAMFCMRQKQALARLNRAM